MCAKLFLGQFLFVLLSNNLVAVNKDGMSVRFNNSQGTWGVGTSKKVAKIRLACRSSHRFNTLYIVLDVMQIIRSNMLHV